MPLLRAKPGAIPDQHDGCFESPCFACSAESELTADDWAIVDFWVRVQDQVVNIFPNQAEGQPYLAPRLEAWVAALDLFSVPADGRRTMIEQAEFLHELMHDRRKLNIAHTLDPVLLRPLGA